MVGLTYVHYVCKLYVQSFLHIQKAMFLFFFVYIFIYIFIYLYIEIFHILPTSICTTIMKKKNIYICQSIFSFILQMYFHKNISLYKKSFLFINMFSL